MASDLILAVWDGPFDAELPDATVLRRGDTHLVSEEDLKSAHWKRAPKGTRASIPGDKPDGGDS